MQNSSTQDDHFLESKIEEFRDTHRSLRLAEWKTYFPWNNNKLSTIYNTKKESVHSGNFNVFVVLLDNFLLSRKFFHCISRDLLQNITSQLKNCSFVLLSNNLGLKSLKVVNYDNISFSRVQIDFLNVFMSLRSLKTKLLLVSKYPLNDIVCVLLLLKQNFDAFDIFDILISTTRYNVETLMNSLLNEHYYKLTVITENENVNYFKTKYTNTKLININDMDADQMKKEIYS